MKSKHNIIAVDIYTDPLCCWSYAFEKHWVKFALEYRDVITFRYIMCGMIPSWRSYKDPMNAISTPAQMGPLWMYASEVTQTEMADSIWSEDPPASSFPACVAVKTAGLQSAEAENAYLQAVHHAVMIDGKNIAKKDVLIKVARELTLPGFSFQQFEKDLTAGAGRNAFSADILKAKLNNIGRYPTLTFYHDSQGFTIVGYRPYEALCEAFNAALATLQVHV